MPDDTKTSERATVQAMQLALAELLAAIEARPALDIAALGTGIAQAVAQGVAALNMQPPHVTVQPTIECAPTLKSDWTTLKVNSVDSDGRRRTLTITKE